MFPLHGAAQLTFFCFFIKDGVFWFVTSRDSFFDSAAARFKTYLQAGGPAAVEIQIPDESNRVESGGQYAS